MSVHTVFAIAALLAVSPSFASPLSPRAVCYGLGDGTSFTTGGKEFLITADVVKSTHNLGGPLWDLTFEGCIASCAADSACVDLSYTSGGTCYLKAGIVVDSASFSETGTCDAMLIGDASSPSSTPSPAASTCAPLTVTEPASFCPTIPAITETASCATATVTSPVTLPASTVTESASAITSTLTVTASPSAATNICASPTPAVINPSFTPSTAPWALVSAGDSTLERVSTTAGSGSALRVRINAANANLPQSILQAVRLCAGTTYRLSFSARRVTTSGVISVSASVTHPGATVVVVPVTVVASSTGMGFVGLDVVVPEDRTYPDGVVPALVRVVVSFSSGAGQAKEVQLSEVALVPVV